LRNPSAVRSSVPALAAICLAFLGLVLLTAPSAHSEEGSRRSGPVTKQPPAVLAEAPAPADSASGYGPMYIVPKLPLAPSRGKDVYRALLGNLTIDEPSDTLGRRGYLEAQSLFEAGLFDSAATLFQRFAVAYPRNLLVNDAIERVLLIRENREPGDEALKLYAHTISLRMAGLPDSAAAAAQAGLSRYPTSRIRYHWQYLLAQIARDRGHHQDAIRFALLVADSTSKSRLVPYALKLAGDETVAMGDDPAKALRLYQSLLERYPTSPLAPPVRAQVLEIRKKLQL
jgi:TolA-binding protein